jgi:hypothetical protein
MIIKEFFDTGSGSLSGKVLKVRVCAGVWVDVISV